MSSRESEFWTNGHKYEDLAREYEQNIERTHPGAVTSRGMCVCLKYTAWCSRATTSVTYYEYRGPSI